MTISDRVRFCADIGLFAIDRPRSTCKHRTAFCAKHCYNGKLETCYKGMKGADRKNEEAWMTMTERDVVALFDKLERSKKYDGRFRLMTRGEAFSTVADVARVEMILEEAAKRDCLVWIPTRAWRSAKVWPLVTELVTKYPNARIQCSTDPSDEDSPVGIGSMYFGDDDATTCRVLCPKTHGGKHGACKTCTVGCFAPSIKHVHLKQH